MVEVKIIGDDDPREALRGQRGLFAKVDIEEFSFIGIYAGKIWDEEEYLEHIESKCIHH